MNNNEQHVTSAKVYECPCNDGCPNGCPCPVYHCPSVATTTTPTTITHPVPQLETVLVLYNSSMALMTGAAGDVTELDWEVKNMTNLDSLCSLTFKNEMFIYGQILTDDSQLFTI